MLFNKANKGAEEMKALLGFIYKSNKFENLFSFQKIAERHLELLVGPEILVLADAHYKSENYMVADQEDPALKILDELVNSCQLPLAFDTYRRYVPSNDLTHSPDGRQMMSKADGPKSPFQWMIDRDDANMLDLCHDFLDLLFVFLYKNSAPVLVWLPEIDYNVATFVQNDGNIYYVATAHTSTILENNIGTGALKKCYITHVLPAEWVANTQEEPKTYSELDYCLQDGKIYQCTTDHTPAVFADDLDAGYWIERYNASCMLFEWSMSAAYTEASELFVRTVADFNRIYDIKMSGRLFFSLVPVLKRMQNEHIRACMTQELYDIIRSEHLTNSLSTAHNVLLVQAQSALVFLTLSEALLSLTVEAFPDSIVRQFSNETRPEKTDRIALSNAIKAIADLKLTLLQDAIAAYNVELYGAPNDTTTSFIQDQISQPNKFYRPS